MSTQRLQPTCYMCDGPAASVEHAPAQCFFPKGYRLNLITVPSCLLHNNFISKDDGKSDIEDRLPIYKDIPVWHRFEGANQSVFKYQFFDGNVDGQPNCVLRMIFYEGFEVLIMPRSKKLILPPQWRKS